MFRLTKAGTAGATAYLLLVLILAVISFAPEADQPGTYVALWVVTLPLSFITGPLYFIASALLDRALGDLIWIFHIVWWVFSGLLEILAITLFVRLLRKKKQAGHQG